MADHDTWGWYSPTQWPGFSPTNQDNLGSNGNGKSIDPASYAEFTMRDLDGDGLIYDHDTDDVWPASYSEYVFTPTLTLHPQEIALYTDSTVVVGGVTYTGLNMLVTLFEDGSWGARLMDSAIPAGTHHQNVTSITLGTWNGVEYDGLTMANADDPFVCFAAGTRIATPDGTRAVETLRAGDLVLTRDYGAQPIVWSQKRKTSGDGANAPYGVAKDAFGAHDALCLSGQHRLLLTEPSGREWLCAIKHLADACPDGGVVQHPRDARSLVYCHFLLPHHALVQASGLWAESFFPGPQALRQIPPSDRARIERLVSPSGKTGYPPARPILGRRDARDLIATVGLRQLMAQTSVKTEALPT